MSLGIFSRVGMSGWLYRSGNRAGSISPLPSNWYRDHDDLGDGRDPRQSYLQTSRQSPRSHGSDPFDDEVLPVELARIRQRKEKGVNDANRSLNGPLRSAGRSDESTSASSNRTSTKMHQTGPKSPGPKSPGPKSPGPESPKQHTGRPRPRLCSTMAKSMVSAALGLRKSPRLSETENLDEVGRQFENLNVSRSQREIKFD